MVLSNGAFTPLLLAYKSLPPPTGTNGEHCVSPNSARNTLHSATQRRRFVLLLKASPASSLFNT